MEKAPPRILVLLFALVAPIDSLCFKVLVNMCVPNDYSSGLAKYGLAATLPY